MFSGLGSPWKGVQRRLSRSISRASEILTGVGPTPTKQFKNAIIDGEEDKAIDLYTANEGDKPLYAELPPSKPFPSKKPQSSGDTPLHMSARMGLMRLCVTLLGRGGDPTVLNSKLETALHSVCSQADSAEIRAAIMEILLQWKGGESNEEKVSLNRVDADGNTAIHLAALNGLVSCVEKLIALGAIISIVNKNNRTCCELADENQHKDLALALELALVFQPVDTSMAEFASHQNFPYEGVPGRLFLNGETLASQGLDAFIEEAVLFVSEGLRRAHTEKGSNQSSNGKLHHAESTDPALPALRARAEILLGAYSWDTVKLLREYDADASKVLTAARLQPLNMQAIADVCTLKTAEEEPVPSASELPAAAMDAAVSTTTTPDEGPGDASSSNATTAPTDEADVPATVTTDAAESVPAAANEPASAADSSPPVADTKKAVPEPPSRSAMAEAEDVCFICGDCMLPPLDAQVFLLGEATQPGSRRLQCDSGHSFCVDCWSGSVTVQVKDNGLGCMPCPGFKCGELLDLRWAPVLLKSSELLSQLMGRRQRLVVDCCTALKTCPMENCGLVVRVQHPSEQSSSASAVKHNVPTSSLCDNGHLFCWECSQPAHSPCSCQQHPAWHQLIKEEIQSVDLKGKGGDDTNVEGAELANALWVAANTKRCPRCQTPIEKDEGCNHMNCRKCRKEFCWICMQDWALHSDNTGGYFQCNRYVANLRVRDLPEGGGGVGELWAEESGNAHAETLRLREKNKRMARFIHHFTRYQAHGESVKLEGRMFKETANRIRAGLLAFLSGGSLKWLQGYQAPNPLLHSEGSASAVHGDAAPSLAGEKGQAGEAPSASASASASGSAAVQSAHNDARVDEATLNYSYATGFLKGGFEELLKCRCILQWSYPYAYFEFENDDHGDYSRGTPQQRRARNDRSSSYRSSFDLLQAELESIVETLSDVVARRRLRAGRDQIILVTRAARSKRIELESLIVTYAVSIQAAAERRANGSRSSPVSPPSLSAMRTAVARTRPEGYHRTRPISNPGSARPHRSRHGDGSSLLMRSDSNDSTDLAALLYELELASTEEISAAALLQRTTPAAPNATPASAGEGEGDGSDNIAAGAAMEALLDRQRRLELMQLRMRLIFGTDVPNDATTRDNTDLPPPIPSDAASLATGTQQSSRGTPSARRVELRQVRSSPGQRMNYTIDPDFELDEESDDEDTGRRAAPAVLGQGSLLHAGERPSEGEGSSSEETDQLPSLDGASIAIRNLLRFGTPDQINQTADALPRTVAMAGQVRQQSSESASRQQMRLARMTQRAEEEANLNRAILMSLQENQTPDRRRAAEGAESSAAPAVASDQPINEADVAMLVSMGFTREQSLQALVENRHNVELAANRLLGIDF